MSSQTAATTGAARKGSSTQLTKPHAPIGIKYDPLPPLSVGTKKNRSKGGLATKMKATASTSAVVGTKRPLSSTSDKNNEQADNKTNTGRTLAPLDRSGRNLSEKKIRRLEKNRLSARECRRKKREAAQNLEREIFALEAENLRLRLQLRVGDEAEDDAQREQDRLTDELNSLLELGASERDVHEAIEGYKEKFADYGRDKRSAVEFHLRNVAKLLMPTQTTMVTMNALRSEGGSLALSARAASGNVGEGTGLRTENGAASASGLASSAASIKTTQRAPPPPTTTPTETAADIDRSDPKALFQYLVNYLDVTPEQALALKDSRHVAKELDAALVQSLSMLEELRCRLARCGEDLDAEFTKLRNILTPTQTAKFLVWVSNNGACMHMLDELWSRVYPEDDAGALADEAQAGTPATATVAADVEGTTKSGTNSDSCPDAVAVAVADLKTVAGSGAVLPTTPLTTPKTEMEDNISTVRSKG